MVSVIRRGAALLGAAVLLLASAPDAALAHKAHQERARAAEAAQSQPAVPPTAPPAPELVAAEPAMPHAGPGHHSAMAGMAAGDAEELTPAERRARMNFVERLSDWLGRWHVSVVHFPIALILVALGLELWALVRRKPAITTATRILIALGALGAVASAAMGWLAMGFDLAQDDWIHRSHRWLGTSVALLALATWWLRERSAAEEGRGSRLLYRAALTLTGLAVAANGFLGGSMTYGIDHLAW